MKRILLSAVFSLLLISMVIESVSARNNIADVSHGHPVFGRVITANLVPQERMRMTVTFEAALNHKVEYQINDFPTVTILKSQGQQTVIIENTSQQMWYVRVRDYVMRRSCDFLWFGCSDKWELNANVNDGTKRDDYARFGFEDQGDNDYNDTEITFEILR